MDIIKKLDDYLVGREGRDSTSHHPSGATKCIRAMYYRWTKEEESNPITAGSYWKMEMGNSIHGMINEFFKEAGLDVIDEVSFKQDVEGLDHPISGRLDNVFVDEDSHISGIELKTMYGRGIQMLQKEGAPKLEHLYQVCLYLYCTEINKFYLIYVGRDNAYRTQFELVMKGDEIFCNDTKLEVTFEKIIEKYKQVDEAVRNKELPGRDYKAGFVFGEIKDKFVASGETYKTDWQCSYCMWCNKCWEKTIADSKDGKYFGEDKIV